MVIHYGRIRKISPTKQTKGEKLPIPKILVKYMKKKTMF